MKFFFYRSLFICSIYYYDQKFQISLFTEVDNAVLVFDLGLILIFIFSLFVSSHSSVKWDLLALAKPNYGICILEYCRTVFHGKGNLTILTIIYTVWNPHLMYIFKTFAIKVSESYVVFFVFLFYFFVCLALFFYRSGNFKTRMNLVFGCNED